MKEKTAAPAVPDAGLDEPAAKLTEIFETGEDFDKKLAAYKQRMKAHTDAIKQHLTQFISRTLSPPDDVTVTWALLELGFERQIDLLGEEDAQDLIERAFRRVVKERRGPLQ